MPTPTTRRRSPAATFFARMMEKTPLPSRTTGFAATIPSETREFHEL
ncbi:MAG: hypothetical protein ACRDD1_04620 [Planctomycetia bacterium]